MKEDKIYKTIGQATAIVGLAGVYVGMFIAWVIR